MACVSAPCFSCYQYGNSRPVFCHAQPPCFKLGSQILALGLRVCFQFSAVVSTLFCVKARRRSRIIPKTLALSVVTQCRWVDSPTRRLLPRRAIPHGFLCCSVGKRKRSCLTFYLLRVARNPKPLGNIEHICFFGPGTCYKLEFDLFRSDANNMQRTKMSKIDI